MFYVWSCFGGYSIELFLIFFLILNLNNFTLMHLRCFHFHFFGFLVEFTLVIQLFFYCCQYQTRHRCPFVLGECWVWPQLVVVLLFKQQALMGFLLPDESGFVAHESGRVALSSRLEATKSNDLFLFWCLSNLLQAFQSS